MKKTSVLLMSLVLASLVVTGCGQQVTSSITSGSEPTSSTSTKTSRTPTDKAPILTFYGAKENEVFSNEPVFLPSYDALDGLGRELEKEDLVIEHLLDGEKIDQPYLPGSSYQGLYDTGKHVFNFTLTDPLNGKSVKDTIKLNVYAKLFWDDCGDPDTIIRNEKSDFATVTTANQGIGVRTFYMERSFRYYAEAEFNGFPGDYRSFGLLHSNNTNLNATGCMFERDVISCTPSVDYMWYYRSGMSWYDSGVRNQSWFNQGTNPVYPELPTLNDTEIFNKVAVARDNDKFYFFFNDVLLQTYSVAAFKYIKTVPGLVFSDYGKESAMQYEPYARNIKFYSGDKAVAKIISLTDDKNLFNYLRYDGEATTEYASFFESETLGSGFELNENALDHDNGDSWWTPCIYPQIRLQGDFKISFDYELTAVRDDEVSTNTRFLMRFAEPTNGDNGYKTEKVNSFTGLCLNYSRGESMWCEPSTGTHPYYSYIENNKWSPTDFNPNDLKTALGLGNGKDKFHLDVEAIFNNSTKIVEFTYKFTSLTDASKTYSYKVRCVRDSSLSALYVYFCYIGVSYRISNFTYDSLGSLDL